MHRLTNITGEKQEAQLSHRGRAMPSAGARLLEQGGHGQFLGAHGEHVEREPITEVWGQSPQRGPGAELFSSRTCNGQSKFVPFAVFSAIHYNKIERCKIRAGTPQ